MGDGRTTAPSASDSDCLLLQFAREPVPGRVKTRMLVQLSAEQACELHSDMVLWTCERLVGARLGDVEVCVAGSRQHPLFRQCLALGAARVTQQRGADLGERMFAALERGLTGYRKVLLVGSDCPQLDADYLQAALDALDEVPVVIGPALDGGYVLIGAQQMDRRIFQAVPWGSGEVYAQTLANIAAAGLAVSSLQPLADVDTPGDLPVWNALRRQTLP